MNLCISKVSEHFSLKLQFSFNQSLKFISHQTLQIIIIVILYSQIINVNNISIACDSLLARTTS